MAEPYVHGTTKTTSGTCKLAPAGSSPTNPPGSSPFIALGSALKVAGSTAFSYAVWGGLDADSCRNALINRGLSTHFLVSPVLYQGVLVVYQALDLARIAYHAGRFNGDSVGIDICRSPLPRFADRYPKGEVIANPSRRGERRIVDLDPDYGEPLRLFLGALAELLEIPFGPYPGDDVLPDAAERRGVLCHHHLSARKWDCAPWAGHIYRAAA